MKMLGNDILTQEEFDTHVAETIVPMQSKSDKHGADIFTLRILTAVSICLSIAALAVTLIR